MRERLAEIDPEILFLEPAEVFDPALMGLAERCGSVPVAAYDGRECVRQLMAEHGWDYEQAEEFFMFNTLGSYVGERTPVFIDVRFCE